MDRGAWKLVMRRCRLRANSLALTVGIALNRRRAFHILPSNSSVCVLLAKDDQL